MKSSRDELLSGAGWRGGSPVLLVLTFLSGSLPLLATTSVTLNASASPASGDAGVSKSV